MGTYQKAFLIVTVNIDSLLDDLVSLHLVGVVSMLKLRSVIDELREVQHAILVMNGGLAVILFFLRVYPSSRAVQCVHLVVSNRRHSGKLLALLNFLLLLRVYVRLRQRSTVYFSVFCF